ncbi:SDR family oxidoreductase [bacterium]|nr:SDR family oxidoreductase [bacterium]
MKKNIFITGGAGYVGSVLVPKLLNLDYKVTVYDLMLYGTDVIKKNPNLTKINGDIRNFNLITNTLEKTKYDAFIHLACISNDPSFELNPSLGKSINLDAFRPLVEASLNAGVKHFIYASSSSVYGVKKEVNVNEEMSLEPLTDYSLFKAECEKILSEYESDTFITTTLRPATVCGFAPRQRLDVVVNILTNLAFHKREITIFGGKQLRPNINILDMADAYISILEASTEKVNKQIFNVGGENHSVEEIANIVKNTIGDDVSLITTPTNDNRSYHISSQKIREIIDFNPIYSVKDSVLSLKQAFEDNKLNDPLNNKLYFNIKTMQSIKMV